MGIVNVNDDSFSGDGSLDLEREMAKARAMVAAGADIIDVGAESARTNRRAIAVGEEVARLTPFIERFEGDVASAAPGDAGQLWPPLLSLNTWRPEVAEQTLPLGGDILNDIGGLPDAANAAICARHGAALLVMHSVGAPKVSHVHQAYPDVWEAMEAFFEEKLAVCRAAGLPHERTLLDPGIDFAKQRADNLRIYRQLDRLKRFGRPLLLPISRKTVIGDVLGIAAPVERDAGTIASLVAGFGRGAQIFRVHNVTAAVRATRVLHALDAAGVP